MGFNQELIEDMNIVIVGHVDHGKSTVIGRLLADTNSLPQGKLEQIYEKCRRNSKPFEYAFLLDALKDEQEQGITIDSARCFFKTKKRNYNIIDAPGHIEFLKNMVTGASRAEAALLVIDAYEGIQENSKRHGYLLSMLGVKQICVLVNKMDLIDYCESKFKKITEEYGEFLGKIGLKATAFIPISAFKGEHIVKRSDNMLWYTGETVVEILEKFQSEKLPEDKPFRMSVQGTYKFTMNGDDRRIVAGTIDTGTIHVNDEIIFYPSGKKSHVKSIEAFHEDKKTSVSAGYATGLTLSEQVYTKRGEMLTVAGQSKPRVASRIQVKIFWLGKTPMEKGGRYYLKLGTAKVGVCIEEIQKVLDASTLQSCTPDFIGRNDVAECILKLEKPIAFDLIYDNFYTSRFVIIDEYEISGGGIIVNSLDDRQSWVRDKVIVRNFKWENSGIGEEERASKNKHKSVLVIITGPKDSGKKRIARALEKKLFNDNRAAYFLSIGNILYGVDADIKCSLNDFKEEHLRRLGEISNIMLDAGNILIVTAIALSDEDLDEIKTIVNHEKIKVVWVGKEITSDIQFDLHIEENDQIGNALYQIEEMLIKANILNN